MKIAVVILAHPQNKGALARAVNGFELAKEAAENGDEVRIIFDGAGTMWVPELGDENHRYHRLFLKVKPRITAVCSYCAKVFKVREQIEELDFPLVDEYEGHPSLRRLLAEGFELVTF